jgi:hypothetical protein
VVSPPTTVVVPPPPEPKPHPPLLTVGGPILGTLVAALIAASSAFGGALLASKTTLDSIQQESKEQRAKETRDKVSQVYGDYLKAATTYRDRTEIAVREVAKQRAEKKPYNANSVVLRQFNDARRTYQDQANQIAIYGTEAAWKAHEVIAKAMPPTLGVVYVDKRPDYVRFSNGYREFMAVFCTEAAATPKQGCSDIRAVGAPREGR